MRIPATTALSLGLLCTMATSPLAAEPTTVSELSHIHGIAFDPSKPGGILLATHYGVYRASPEGMVETVSLDANDYMGFSPDPGDAGRLLASGHPGQGGNMGVIVSTDGGVTWQKIAEGVGGPVDFHAMAISRVDPDVIYGLFDGIQVSRDGGTSWTVAGPGPERILDLAASPVDADTVYAGAVGGLMRSVDAGQTWALIGPSGQATTLVESTADGSIYAFLAGAGLFRLSKDGTWTELANEFGGGYILHLAGDPADAAHLVAVTDASAVLESRDGGKTWLGFAQ